MKKERGESRNIVYSPLTLVDTVDAINVNLGLQDIWITSVVKQTKQLNNLAASKMDTSSLASVFCGERQCCGWQIILLGVLRSTSPNTNTRTSGIECLTYELVANHCYQRYLNTSGLGYWRKICSCNYWRRDMENRCNCKTEFQILLGEKKKRWRK